MITEEAKKLESPEGRPIVTRQEVEEGISIPSTMGLYGTPPDTLQRLCEYDEDGQSGCRRTQTILALEEDYNIFVSPEMRWGYWDLFCAHENLMFYDRNFLSYNMELEQGEMEEDTPEFHAIVEEVNQYAGRPWVTYTEERLYDLIHSGVKGLPKFIPSMETERFYCCENVGTNMVTAQNITRHTLDIIQSSFTDDTNPFLMDVEGSIYIKGGKAYCTNPFVFNINPNAKLGIMLEDTVNEKMLFFPFKPLTEEQEDFVTKLAYADMLRDVEIVNL